MLSSEFLLESYLPSVSGEGEVDLRFKRLPPRSVAPVTAEARLCERGAGSSCGDGACASSSPCSSVSSCRRCCTVVLSRLAASLAIFPIGCRFLSILSACFRREALSIDS